MSLTIFPIDFVDLIILFAMTSITLLVTSELVSSYRGKISILINRKKLRRASIAFSILFLVTISIKIYSVISAM